MKSLRCWFGLHRWKYTPAAYDSVQMERLAIPRLPAIRTCGSCGRAEWRDEHLLGHNPTEYTYTWYKL